MDKDIEDFYIASWHPVSKENSKGRVKLSLFR
jgi:hypothetical protein